MHRSRRNTHSLSKTPHGFYSGQCKPQCRYVSLKIFSPAKSTRESSERAYAGGSRCQKSRIPPWEVSLRHSHVILANSLVNYQQRVGLIIGRVHILPRVRRSPVLYPGHSWPWQSWQWNAVRSKRPSNVALSAPPYQIHFCVGSWKSKQWVGIETSVQGSCHTSSASRSSIFLNRRYLKRKRMCRPGVRIETRLC